MRRPSSAGALRPPIRRIFYGPARWSPPSIYARCAPALYWANIGRLVYGVDETKLPALTGDDAKNPTMSLEARVVLGSGQKRIEVHGPFPEIEDELIGVHRDFWQR